VFIQQNPPICGFNLLTVYIFQRLLSIHLNDLSIIRTIRRAAHVPFRFLPVSVSRPGSNYVKKGRNGEFLCRVLDNRVPAGYNAVKLNRKGDDEEDGGILFLREVAVGASHGNQARLFVASELEGRKREQVDPSRDGRVSAWGLMEPKRDGRNVVI